MVDASIAELYRVETRVLVQAVTRNRARLPDDFMFRLTAAEYSTLKSQSVISNSRGGRRTRPYAFTEQGVAMLSSILRSPRAVTVNVEIMRAFVRVREVVAGRADLVRRLDTLEQRYDQQFRTVFDAIRALVIEEAKPRRRIGFHRPVRRRLPTTHHPPPVVFGRSQTPGIPLKIAVCIKRVPDMDVRFKIAPSGKAVDESGLKFDISDFDGYAVEAALQIKEKLNAGEVVVISLGPDVVQETLRKAMSMGADRAVQLKADAVPADSYAIATALAAELKDGGYDLIMFGRMSIDTAHGATGAMTAELLGLPVVNAISKLEFDGRTAKMRRELEGAYELVECPLPAVVTIDEGIARPRYPSLKGIMAAKKKPLETKPAQLADQRLALDAMALPPERTAGRIIGEGSAVVPELVRLLKEEAKVL